jgi:alpha,alpha-trehalase
MATVDLNSLLYKYEIDIAHLLGELSGPSAPLSPTGPSRSKRSADDTPQVLCERASRRFSLMKRHLWSAQDGLFYDALVTPAGTLQTGYVSATTLYPLWATAEAPGRCAPAPLSDEERSALVTNALGQLESAGGLLITAPASRDLYSDRADRQWDYPNGWAPHQMLAWRGLSAHGFEEDAQRLAFSWLFTLLSNVVDFNGTIPEKYDVVERTHAVFSEYGNVGTEFDYIANEGFGWVNASFQVGLSVLSPKERRRLGQAITRR